MEDLIYDKILDGEDLVKEVVKHHGSTIMSMIKHCKIIQLFLNYDTTN